MIFWTNKGMKDAISQAISITLIIKTSVTLLNLCLYLAIRTDSYTYVFGSQRAKWSGNSAVFSWSIMSQSHVLVNVHVVIWSLAKKTSTKSMAL